MINELSDIKTFLPEYIQKHFANYVKISHWSKSDIKLVDPSEFEFDPFGQNKPSKDLFYNRFETCLAVALVHRCLIQVDPMPLIEIRRTIQEQGLLQTKEGQLSNEFLHALLLQITVFRKQYDPYTKNFLKTYENGPFSPIYNVVQKNSLHITLGQILQKKWSQNNTGHQPLSDIAKVEIVHNWLHLTIDLLDTVEPLEIENSPFTLSFFRDPSHGESPYLLLSKFRNLEQLKTLFDVQRKLYVKTVQLALMSQVILCEKTPFEPLLFYIKENVKKSNYKQFMQTILLYDDRITGQIIQGLLESQASIKEQFSAGEEAANRSMAENPLMISGNFDDFNQDAGEIQILDEGDEEFDPCKDLNYQPLRQQQTNTVQTKIEDEYEELEIEDDDGDDEFVP